MILILYMINLLFYISVCGFFLNYYSYLKSLIMVEFIMVSIILIMVMGVYGICHYVIFVLILSVCEGILGLLVMTLMRRMWGSDMYVLVDFSF